jgi:hypothetical protein
VTVSHRSTDPPVRPVAGHRTTGATVWPVTVPTGATVWPVTVPTVATVPPVTGPIYGGTGATGQ